MPRPFSPYHFFLAVCALSWPFQIVYACCARSPLQSFALSSASMVMAGAATALAAYLGFKDGLARAGWRLGRPIHYLGALTLPVFLWLLPTVLESAFRLRPALAWGSLLGLPLAFGLRFLATLLPAFGEELAWRGYLLPRLVTTHGLRRGLLLHGVITWLWHLPVLIAIGLKPVPGTSTPLSGLAALLAVSLIPTVMHAVVFAFFWARSSSLFVATIYHSAFDELRDALDRTVGLGPLADPWQAGFLTLFGVLLLWKGHWAVPGLSAAPTSMSRDERRPTMA